VDENWQPEMCGVTYNFEPTHDRKGVWSLKVRCQAA